MNDGSASPSRLPLSAEQQIDALCDAHAVAWRAGKPQRVEDLLLKAPEVARSRLLRELLLTELEERIAAGESPIPLEYVRRFPDDRSTVEAVFAQMQERDPSAAESSDEQVLDDLLAAYLRRIDAGETIELPLLKREQPEWAEPLWELLGTAALIDHMAGPRQSDAGDDATLAIPGPNAATEIATERLPPDDRRIEEACAVDEMLRRMALRPARVFGDYELLEVVGEGGMGVVYRARQISLDRTVAVKMIRSGLLASDDDVRRFQLEAQAAGRTGHPHIVSVYQIGELEGHHYFSMDFIDGVDLAERVREGPLPCREAATYLVTIAEAIQAAHDQGILHRDLKPANVLLDSAGRPLVTDFGLAKQVDDSSGHTSSGTTLGTPSYMSPEQAAGKTREISERSDVYSLGALLYAMLTGSPPFRGETAVKTMLEVMHRQPESPRQNNPRVDADLETICLKCLEKDPADRYASAQALADDLRRYLQGKPIEARPQTWWQQTWAWWRDVPIVAAVLGRTAHPSPAHRATQRLLIAAAILLPVLLLASTAARQWWAQQMPAQIRIASGRRGGMYHSLATELASELGRRAKREVDVHATSGSGENLQAVLQQTRELALLQASHLKGRETAVIAPLYYEVVHVIVRKASKIEKMADLTGRAVALGPPSSGMRATALTILRHYRLPANSLQETTANFERLAGDAKLDAAIVTIGLENQAVADLLRTGKFRLLPLPNPSRIVHPSLRAYALEASAYGAQAGIPAGGLSTVATPSFLATHRSAPDVLVTTTLEALYALPLRPGRIPREVARDWPGLPFHPAAARFFSAQPPPGG